MTLYIDVDDTPTINQPLVDAIITWQQFVDVVAEAAS